MLRLAAALSLAMLSACVSSEAVHGPSNRPTYAVECSGAAYSIGDCYNEARKRCPHGYGLVGYDMGGGPMIGQMMGSGTLFMVPSVDRSIVVECK